MAEDVGEGYRLPAAKGCPRAVYALMIDCWHPEQHRRPSFEQICQRLTEIKKDAQLRDTLCTGAVEPLQNRYRRMEDDGAIYGTRWMLPASGSSTDHGPEFAKGDGDEFGFEQTSYEVPVALNEDYLAASVGPHSAYDMPLFNSANDESAYDEPIAPDARAKPGEGDYDFPLEQEGGDTYEEPQQLPWLFESLSREAAERLLRARLPDPADPRHNGRFLVRKKDKPGSFAVSVLWDGRIIHHLFEEPMPGVWVVNGVAGPTDVYTLADLVEMFGKPGSWRTLLLHPVTSLQV